MPKSIDCEFKTILISGSCGFIGFHCSVHFLNLGHQVIGIDSLYEDENFDFKIARLNALKAHPKFEFEQFDISNDEKVNHIFNYKTINFVIHLAAKTGVRRSEEDFENYMLSNVNGTRNIFEAIKEKNIPIVYASSSSVYGDTEVETFDELLPITSPKSIYGLTKIATENLASYYQKKYSINVIGLRFFTVYGDMPRKDMAIWKFINAIDKGLPITLFNNGNFYRDFTHVTDIIACVNLFFNQMKDDKVTYQNEIFNLGYGSSIMVFQLVELLENMMKKKAIVIKENGLFEDLLTTKADNSKLSTAIGFKPQIDIKEGLSRTIDWYNSHVKRGK